MKNLHIPIQLMWYEKLRTLSEERQTSVTEVIRTALINYVQEEEKKSIDNAITSFARTYGGSEFDVDHSLEQAGLETLPTL